MWRWRWSEWRRRCCRRRPGRQTQSQRHRDEASRRRPVCSARVFRSAVETLTESASAARVMDRIDPVCCTICCKRRYLKRCRSRQGGCCAGNELQASVGSASHQDTSLMAGAHSLTLEWPWTATGLLVQLSVNRRYICFCCDLVFQ